MFLIASFIFLIMLIGYALFAWAIVYHIQAYTVPGDISRPMLIVFLAISVILMLAAVYFFFRVPWEDINGSFTIELPYSP